jgi:hypothetical protein
MVRCETRPFGETFYLKTKEINYQDRLGTNVDKVEARRGVCCSLLPAGTSPPMSTYLVAFVIGELTRVSSSVAGRGGTVVNVWSVPELAPNLGEILNEKEKRALVFAPFSLLFP